MDNEIEIIYDHNNNEPYCMIFKGKEYLWNGEFCVDISIMEEMSLPQLPVGIAFKPIFKQDKKGIHKTTSSDFSIVKTKNGDIVAYVDGHEYVKYWQNPTISLNCYIQSKMEEIKEDNEFELLDYESDNDIHYYYSFEIKLIGVETMKEATRAALQSLQALEKRTRWRIVEKVEKWAKENI